MRNAGGFAPSMVSPVHPERLSIDGEEKVIWTSTVPCTGAS
ncbi:hypothetical protein ACFW17_22720 [Streptomyces sp. NPDC058961]